MSLFVLLTGVFFIVSFQVVLKDSCRYPRICPSTATVPYCFFLFLQLSLFIFWSTANIFHFKKITVFFSVADPGPGAFLTPRSRSRIWDGNPESYHNSESLVKLLRFKYRVLEFFIAVPDPKYFRPWVRDEKIRIWSYFMVLLSERPLRMVFEVRNLNFCDLMWIVDIRMLREKCRITISSGISNAWIAKSEFPFVFHVAV